MIVQEKEPLSPLKNKGCKSLVICTLLLFTCSEDITLTKSDTLRDTSTIHHLLQTLHHPLQTHKSLYNNHPHSPSRSPLCI